MRTVVTLLLLICLSASAAAQSPAWNLGELKNEAKALDAAKLAEVRKSAVAGDARAQFVLGLAYEEGHAGLTKDPDAALPWFILAANQNIGLAEAWVGDFYDTGIGSTKKDPAEALKWYRRSASHGYKYAIDKVKAAEQATIAQPTSPSAGSSGPQPASMVPARAVAATWDYDQTMGEAKSMDAAAYARNLALANSGDARAQFLVGLALENGYAGVTKDVTAAFNWFVRSAEPSTSGGLADAWVGDFYFDGLNGTPINYGEARRRYSRAAEKGYAYGASRMGYMALFGMGSTENRADANAWYQRAVDLGRTWDALERDVTASTCSTDFCRVLRQAIVLRDSGFSRWKGTQLEGLDDTAEWRASAALPGAECKVSEDKEYGDITYYCDFGTYSESTALNVFDNVARQLREFTPPGWSSDRKLYDWGGDFRLGPPGENSLVFVSLHPSMDSMWGGGGNQRYVLLSIRKKK